MVYPGVMLPSPAGQLIWIGTSWKMNFTIGQSCDYVTTLAEALPVEGTQPFILPAHTSLAAVTSSLPDNTGLLVGAQNAHWAQEGSGTGEISMRMVADAGAAIVELGHSERRSQFGETDQTVSLKVRAAADHGLIPLICLGEPAHVREAGGATDYVEAQLSRATALLTPQEVGKVLIAYEPVWAIGENGRPATSDETGPIMKTLAAQLSGLSASGGCRALLYGGGVNTANARDLLQDPHTDGLFVGRAAWSAAGMVRLLEIAASQALHGP